MLAQFHSDHFESTKPPGLFKLMASPLSSPSTVADSKKQRAKAYRHTPEQVRALEQFYESSRVTTKPQREMLSKEIGLTVLQIARWFNARRRKDEATKHRAQPHILPKPDPDAASTSKDLYHDEEGRFRPPSNSTVYAASWIMKHAPQPGNKEPSSTLPPPQQPTMPFPTPPETPMPMQPSVHGMIYRYPRLLHNQLMPPVWHPYPPATYFSHAGPSSVRPQLGDFAPRYSHPFPPPVPISPAYGCEPPKTPRPTPTRCQTPNYDHNYPIPPRPPVPVSPACGFEPANIPTPVQQNAEDGRCSRPLDQATTPGLYGAQCSGPAVTVGDVRPSSVAALLNPIGTASSASSEDSDAEPAAKMAMTESHRSSEPDPNKGVNAETTRFQFQSNTVPPGYLYPPRFPGVPHFPGTTMMPQASQAQFGLWNRGFRGNVGTFPHQTFIPQYAPFMAGRFRPISPQPAELPAAGSPDVGPMTSTDGGFARTEAGHQQPVVEQLDSSQTKSYVSQPYFGHVGGIFPPFSYLPHGFGAPLPPGMSVPVCATSRVMQAPQQSWKRAPRHPEQMPANGPFPFHGPHPSTTDASVPILPQNQSNEVFDILPLEDDMCGIEENRDEEEPESPSLVSNVSQMPVPLPVAGPSGSQADPQPELPVANVGRVETKPGISYVGDGLGLLISALETDQSILTISDEPDANEESCG